MIKLYSRQDCPLCEEVEDQIIGLQIKYVYIDIDGDEILRKKYHTSVPVLMNNNKETLLWPFSSTELEAFAQN